MSQTYNAGIFSTRTGRIRGTYVYMLLCRDDGPLYVKIGITNDPMRRIQSLRHGCPVTPRQFAFCETPSQPKAESLEKALLTTLKQWRAHGEWLRLQLSDRVEFNAAWRGVFQLHSSESLQLRWTQVSMKQLTRYFEQQRKHFQHRYAKRLRKGGRAFADFLQHQSDRSA